MSWKNRTDIGAGVIDADYRGEIGVVTFNHSDVDLCIKETDHVTQLIIENINTSPLVEVDLDDMDRGCDGYGSRG